MNLMLDQLRATFFENRAIWNMAHYQMDYTTPPKKNIHTEET